MASLGVPSFGGGGVDRSMASSLLTIDAWAAFSVPHSADEDLRTQRGPSWRAHVALTRSPIVSAATRLPAAHSTAQMIIVRANPTAS